MPTTFFLCASTVVKRFHRSCLIVDATSSSVIQETSVARSAAAVHLLAVDSAWTIRKIELLAERRVL